ncbi:Gfo/Idh/MocA family oxidoreductase [Mucilaginibacter sp. BJC16-A38]|uniref:Gfo/Idh/MocA family oxidoreductase n=1 Tax=Mucilaginibacter phenanthrenivorans TaxID=1234842 RepID=UPI002157CAA7|nr:Gfo/Idh/MocA family oxidoreductase [Mucilaginibacter phenanthrenivorans]MCR8561248.1 Gfo/Idh/MocA family oxidoreductase [Mucilaginibacter phenanthrenivorans]
MSKPIVTGLMAYGMSGRIFHAPFLGTKPEFKFKAVVERHEKKAAAIYPDVISYNSIDELLADDEIELVIVNTPNDTHFDFTIRALNAGKHVLLEKPAAATGAEVKIMYDLAREKNLHLMLYQNRRYDSGFLLVKEVIEGGRLGQLIEVHMRMDRYKTALSPKAFKESKAAAANGLVYDLGPHLIDNAIALFGKPLSFTKTTGIYRENSEVPDYFHYHLLYPNQLNVYLTAGLLMAEVMPAFAIYGTLGSFVKDRRDTQETELDKGMMPNDPAYGLEPEGSDGELVIMGPDNKRESEWLKPLRGGYNTLFETVYHTVRDNALYPVTEEHIAWQLELLEA